MYKNKRKIMYKKKIPNQLRLTNSNIAFMSIPGNNAKKLDTAKLQVHNIVSSNKVISQVSFPRGLDKTSTKIIINL